MDLVFDKRWTVVLFLGLATCGWGQTEQKGPTYLQNITDITGKVRTRIDELLASECALRAVLADDPSFPRLSNNLIDKAYVARSGRVVAGAMVANWLGTVHAWVLPNGQILAMLQETTRFYRKADYEAMTNTPLASSTHFPGFQFRASTVYTPAGMRYVKICRHPAGGQYYLTGPDDADALQCMEERFIRPLVEGICRR